MSRYFIKLSYRGAPFHGWQIQPGDITVQYIVESALSRLLKSPVSVTGAGRTDAGVNARMMIAHFDTDRPIASDPTFIRSVNALVGKDISVMTITGVHADAHARFDADSRTYRYFTTSEKSPFLYPLTWKAPQNLDYDLMNQAAGLLLDTSDFASFAKLHSDVKTTICRVTEARWKPAGDNMMMFEITADRFLRNMVRAVVGTLIDVGRKKLAISDFSDIILSENRSLAGTSMPPEPLFLWRITYPYFDSENSVYKHIN